MALIVDLAAFGCTFYRTETG